MLCAVCGCNNCNNRNNKLRRDDVSYFTFPKDPELLKKWIKFCKRKDVFNTTSGRICSDHFTADDMERDFKFELGLVNKKRLRLKPGSIPSVFQKIKDPLKIKDFPFVVTTEFMNLSGSENSIASHNEIEPLETIDEQSIDETEFINMSGCANCVAFKTQVDELRLEMKTKEEKCNRLILSEIKMKEKIKSLEFELQQHKLQESVMKRKLSGIFTTGQIRNLLSKDIKKQRWSKVDIARGITFYSSSSKAYKLLKKKGFPLPAVRTLQRWAQKIDESPEILQPFVSILKETTDVQEAQQEYVLSFDEIKVEK